MDRLIFPPLKVNTRVVEGKTYIFDILRRKDIIATPEEWVRQYLIHFLINKMKYPKSLIKVEDGMKVNKMHKRSDIVVYDRQGQIFLVVECKSAKVKITQKSMDQLSIYNQNYQAKHLVLTNGLKAFICKMDYINKKAVFIEEFPEFQ